MRLEEAAAILGVSVNSDIDLLKQTYRKLALAWHPDKCTDPRAKEKFQQISIAYTKLISSRSTGENDYDSDDEGQFYDDDVNEMRAFVRMFMDLVGIFNDDQGLPDEGKLPGGVSFGMMFGNSTDVHEEWSTDEDDEGELEEEDYDTDNGEDDNEALWEPMAKHHIYMNLKEEVSKAREFLSKAEMPLRDIDEEMEAKRKQRNAKKRAEKRRKQKEKKVREAALKAEEDERIRLADELSRKEQEDSIRRRKEELRLAQEAEDLKRKSLFDLVSKGLSNEVVSLIEQPNSGLKITDRIGPAGRSGAGLLHYCVSHLRNSDVKQIDSLEVQRGKLSIAKYLLSIRSPSIDLGLLDEEGRTVIHVAALFGDTNLIELLVEQRSEQDKKNHCADINSRCLNQGWTPLHYAACNGVVSSVQLLVKLGALLNVHAYVYSNPSNGKDYETKGPTPLELAKKQLQESRNLTSQEMSCLEEVISELTKAVTRLELIRQQREAEKINKESKLKAEKQRLAMKEQAEKELLERKQKQLKEKQLKEKLKNEEDERVALLLASEDSNKKKKKKKDKKKDDDTTELSTDSASRSQENQKMSTLKGTPPILISSPSLSTIVAPVIPVPEPSASVLGDVVSRDDLLSHLLTMGFAESDCLAAISSCGLNVDMAISWLCDRPTPAQKSKQPEVKDAKKSTPGKSPPHVQEQFDAQLKSQKDKEHKEEQRRINRAWNARVPQQRAEEERKKAEAERLQQELERQRLLQQQQLQQQYSMYPQIYNVPQSGAASAHGSGPSPTMNGMYLPQHNPQIMPSGSLNLMHSGMMMPIPTAPQNYQENYPITGNSLYSKRSNQTYPLDPQMSNLQYQHMNMGGIQSQSSPPTGYENYPVMSQSLPIPPRSRGPSLAGVSIEPSSVLDNTSYGGGILQSQMNPPQGSLNILNSTPMYDPHTGQLLSNQHLSQSPQTTPLGYHLPQSEFGYISNYDHSLNPPNNDSLNEISHDDSVPYVDGAVHLSAVAKPFVPKFAASPSPVTSHLQMPSLDRSDSTGVSLNVATFSLPPLTLQRPADTGSWPSAQDSSSVTWNTSHTPDLSLTGFGSSQSTDPTLDNLMTRPLDLLSFDISGLGPDLTVDLGESLLGRIAGTSSLDRRRNRGLFFQGTNSLNYDLGDEPKLSDEDVLLPLNHFISDVIDSPDIHSVYNPSNIFSDNPP